VTAYRCDVTAPLDVSDTGDGRGDEALQPITRCNRVFSAECLRKRRTTQRDQIVAIDNPQFDGRNENANADVLVSTSVTAAS